MGLNVHVERKRKEAIASPGSEGQGSYRRVNAMREGEGEGKGEGERESERREMSDAAGL